MSGYEYAIKDEVTGIVAGYNQLSRCVAMPLYGQSVAGYSDGAIVQMWFLCSINLIQK